MCVQRMGIFPLHFNVHIQYLYRLLMVAVYTILYKSVLAIAQEQFLLSCSKAFCFVHKLPKITWDTRTMNAIDFTLYPHPRQYTYWGKWCLNVNPPIVCWESGKGAKI